MIDQDIAPFITAEALSDAEYGDYDDIDVAIAVATIRGICGWHISPKISLVFELNSDGSDVMELPSYRIDEPTSVRDGRGVDANDIEGWTWSRNGLIGFPRCGRPRGLGNIVVTAPSGLEHVPADLLAVVADISKQRRDGSKRDFALRQKTVGGVSYTYADLSAGDRGAITGPYARYAPLLDRFIL